MKLDVDLSALHSAVARMTLPQITASRTTTTSHPQATRYHLVHIMEPETSNIAVSTASSRWSSPLIPALYCVFLAEENERIHLSTQDIVALLVRFYGFKRVPLNDTAIEIELYTARDEHCAVAADILQQPLLKKEGLLQAIRDCSPMGFTSFDALMESEQ